MAIKGKSDKKEVPDFEKVTKDDHEVAFNKKEILETATLKTDQSKKVMGLLLCIFSIILFISFVSFFFSWKTDQDFLLSGDFDLFKEHHGKVSNAMGLFGAKLGYWFVLKGFGFAALFMLPVIFLTGTWLLINYRPLQLIRLGLHTVLFVVWFSLLLGFIFHKWAPSAGGAFGYFGVQKISGAIGFIGCFLFLLFYAVAYSILFFNLNPFDKIKLPAFSKVNAVQPWVDDKNEKTEIQETINTGPDLDSLQAEIDTYLNQNKEEEEQSYEDIFDKYKDISIKTKEEKPEKKAIEFDKEEPQTLELTTDTKSVITLDGDFEIEDNTNVEAEFVEENKGEEILEKYGLDTVFDPKLELRDYVFPTLDLLKDFQNVKQEIDVAAIEESKNMIIETLKNYNIGISKIKASVGPTVTLYEIVPAAGVKISKIKNLEDDIALSLAALGIRIIAPIPGKGTIGIEVPNRTPEMVPMKAVLASKKFQDTDMQLPVALGKTISNEIFVVDLAKMPHLLMAGATGQGKSVGLNAILVSLLYKKHPAYVKFVLVDPKKVELTLYNKIERHFLAKLPGDGEAIITDNAKVINTLNSLCIEMDARYKLLQDAMVRTIIEYNDKFVNRKLNPEKGHRFLPYIVVVIDEVADLMMTAGKEIETPIARLAQLARAIGIHLILATQRPSVNVITGMIKANFPSRIAFRVTSKIDSRTILDGNGADQLIGKGDMLYSGGNELIRLQCPFVDTPEVEKICEFIGEQRAFPYAYILPEVKDENGGGDRGEFNPNEKDEMFEDAARIIVQNQVGSTSMIQRKLKIGYNRAGRLMDQLEDAGIVGPNLGSKAREVLIPDEYALEQFLKSIE